MPRVLVTYDADGHPLTVTRLAGTADAVTTTFTYEATWGQVATVTDPPDSQSGTITQTYDLLDRSSNARSPLPASSAAHALATIEAHMADLA
jgi:hypothetical protein